MNRILNQTAYIVCDVFEECFEERLCELFENCFASLSTLKGKNILPLAPWSKFFPFRIDPFSEGSRCEEKKRKL